MRLNEFHHLALGKRVDRLRKLEPLLLTKILDQLIRAEALMALLAVHQRIGKTAQMPGRHPRLRVHQNRAVYADIVGILLHKLLPPRLFDIILQLHAEIPVVPGIREPAVNLGTRIHKASRLRKCGNLIHCFFHILLLPPGPFMLSRL